MGGCPWTLGCCRCVQVSLSVNNLGSTWKTVIFRPVISQKLNQVSPIQHTTSYTYNGQGISYHAITVTCLPSLPFNNKTVLPTVVGTSTSTFYVIQATFRSTEGLRLHIKPRTPRLIVESQGAQHLTISASILQNRLCSAYSVQSPGISGDQTKEPALITDNNSRCCWLRWHG
jgi:hypothetical protein